ncbi:MAG: NAD(P)H-dependent oxidoreductase, partial [Chitinophagaceae bacterium]|nr:NAD(P)H-dependent oxidoreductase [Chitinophagaceae bacterium]
LVFWGSNNPTSINKQLAHYAAAQLQKQITATIIDLNDFPLPLYNIETEIKFGIPVKAKELKELISQYDGYVIAVAEHNGSITAFFKNVLDWVSRVDKSYGIFHEKPVVLLGTSPGPGGAKGALQHAEAIIKRLAGKVIASVSLPLFFGNFKGSEDTYEILDANRKKMIQHALDKLAISAASPVLM